MDIRIDEKALKAIQKGGESVHIQVVTWSVVGEDGNVHHTATSQFPANVSAGRIIGKLWQQAEDVLERLDEEGS